MLLMCLCESGKVSEERPEEGKLLTTVRSRTKEGKNENTVFINQTLLLMCKPK